jgi:hypothetical protein
MKKALNWQNLVPLRHIGIFIWGKLQAYREDITFGLEKQNFAAFLTTPKKNPIN